MFNKKLGSEKSRSFDIKVLRWIFNSNDVGKNFGFTNVNLMSWAVLFYLFYFLILLINFISSFDHWYDSYLSITSS